MVQLTRLSHQPFVLNCDLIELIEATPDTVISLTTGQKLLVCETPDEIIRRVKEYKRSIMEFSCTRREMPESKDSQAQRYAASAKFAEGEVNGGL
jgi:flagellar protein FlbD